MKLFFEVTNFSWNDNCSTWQLNNILDLKKKEKSPEISKGELVTAEYMLELYWQWHRMGGEVHSSFLFS